MPTGPPAPAVPAYPVACWSVPPADCDRIAAEAVSLLLPGGAVPVSVRVSDGNVAVERPGGGGLATAEVDLRGDGTLAFEDLREAGVGPIEPQSLPEPAQVIPFTLGHCGLDSPIDIDGAFWIVDGPVPANAPEAINSAEGQFRRTGADTAEFATATGFRVGLVRHAVRGACRAAIEPAAR